MYIRLLHWNILYKEKIENVYKTISEIKPDVLCLQELTRGFEYNNYKNVPQYLSELLHFEYYFHSAQEDDNKVMGNGIFSRYPIKNTDFKYLKKPTQITGWGDWSKEARIYVEALVDVAGIPITFATTHLSYSSRFIQSDEKKREVDALANIIKNKKEKYILTGDFNSDRLSYTVNTVQNYLVNCGPDTAEKTWTTKPSHDQWGWEENNLNWRLDYVFSTKDMVARSATIINTPYSDHLPIVVEFAV